MKTRVLIACACLICGGASAVEAQGDQLRKLLPTDGAPEDQFGITVALVGSTAIVGAWGDDDNGADSGSVYMFDTITGQQIAKLLPTDGAAGDAFSTLAVGGSTLIVGARRDDDNGSDSGSAYLFDVATGVQLMKLLPSDGSAGDNFGEALAVGLHIVIVGAPEDDDNGTDSGSAYLFDIGTGEQLAKLLPSDGAAGDEFGVSVALTDTVAVVGAFNDDDNGQTSGSVYLFDVVSGVQIAKLTPNDGAAGDWFGRTVASSDTTIIVGARYDDDNGVDSGSAYLFNATTGEQIAKLLPHDGAAGDEFGFPVAISGTTAIVGAYRDDDNGDRSGSAYLFDTTTGAQVAKLLPDDGAALDRFGWMAVAISGSTALVS